MLANTQTQQLLATPGAILLVGERLAGSPGALTVAATVAEHTGARLAWVPRRAGERGAADVGALPNLLPGGRPVADEAARRDRRRLGRCRTPAEPGRATRPSSTRSSADDSMHSSSVVSRSRISPTRTRAHRTGARDLRRQPRAAPQHRHRARRRRVPVAAVAEKSGIFVDWEADRGGSPRRSTRAGGSRITGSSLRSPPRRVPRWVATPPTDPRAAAGDGCVDGQTCRSARRDASSPVVPNTGHALLASWRLLLDRGRLQDGEPNLAATAHAAVVRCSAATATEAGAADGEPLTVTGPTGSVTLPLVVTDMPDGIVWLPLNPRFAGLHAAGRPRGRRGRTGRRRRSRHRHRRGPA